MIECLEKGVVQEAEGGVGVAPIREDCKKAILRVAELSSDDFHLDRYLYFSCRDDRERFCENVSPTAAPLPPPPPPPLYISFSLKDNCGIFNIEPPFWFV